MRPGATGRVVGDPDRLRQVFVHLAAYVLEGRDANVGASIRLGHEGASLEGEIVFVARGALWTGGSICSPASARSLPTRCRPRRCVR